MIRARLLAIGAAGVLALGGAGLYAGSLTATADGTLGSGSTSAQASCARAVDVMPGYSSYQANGLLPARNNDEGFGYNDLDVVITENRDRSCNGKRVRVEVYDQSARNVSVITSSQATISDTPGLAERVRVSLRGYVASGDDLSYAVVVQDDPR